MNDIDRFVRKIVFTDECWTWAAGRFASGYGAFFAGTNNVPAHRFAYETFVSHVPDGLVLDHLCRVRECVNPDHLEAVTQQTNVLRGESDHAKVHRTGVCRRGHSMSDAVIKSGGRRTCRTCQNLLRRARYKRQTSLIR